MKRMLKIGLLGLLAALCLLPVAYADELSADEIYEFTGAEFSVGDQAPEGIYLCAVPDPELCLLCRGERSLCVGDVLAAEDLANMTLRPTSDENGSAELCFRPILNGILGEACSLCMQIRSTRNEAPVARELTLETYKNIPNEGRLQAEDPEGDSLQYQLAEKPRRGSVELRDDGSFLYTPKKNKVGEDSFRYTVTDSAGNVSEPATVCIRILQPLDSETFEDLSPEAQFPAMWLKETGLYGGTRMADRLCFCPDQTVSRGEFLVMTMDLAGIEPEIGMETRLFADQEKAPDWMRPYLSSALRRGIALGYAGEKGLEFRPNQPITGAEAAAILSRTFRLREEGETGSSGFSEAHPAWAQQPIETLEQAGIPLPCGPEELLTRLSAAELLYQANSARSWAK